MLLFSRIKPHNSRGKLVDCLIFVGGGGGSVRIGISVHSTQPKTNRLLSRFLFVVVVLPFFRSVALNLHSFCLWHEFQEFWLDFHGFDARICISI